jgi:hypothetical protein
MPDGNPFGEQRPGLLARLFSGIGGTRRVVRRTERLDVTVPGARADAVKQALEHWLAGYGITATLTVTSAGNGRTRLHADLGEADAAKLNLASQAIQDELQDRLSSAATDPPG